MTSDSSNPYRPPQAEPQDVPRAGAPGSLEQALAGDYDFEIGEVMSEAWELTNGFKATFWGSAVVVYGVTFAIVFLMGYFNQAVFGVRSNFLISLGTNTLAGLLTAPLTLGLTMLAVKRAAGMPLSSGATFGYFDQTVPAVVVGLLSVVATYLGLALLILPGVYLSIAYSLARPLLGDRKLTSWAALEVSRKALTHRWFKIFGLYLFVGVLLVLSALPFGVGLIWTIPWSMLVIGVLYRRVFGTTEPAPSA